mmetsp:Transcript_14269/g.29211  ORF Transcript_14269/g.29211 Transcript_14269/m.29211 type:complete len:83 (+) Transcript_14269:83-331(+)
MVMTMTTTGKEVSTRGCLPTNTAVYVSRASKAQFVRLNHRRWGWSDSREDETVRFAAFELRHIDLEGPVEAINRKGALIQTR